MSHVANEDWSPGEIVIVPHAWRDDDLWQDIQVETQHRIGMDLRRLYDGTLQQPLSSRLARLACEIEHRLEASQQGY